MSYPALKKNSYKLIKTNKKITPQKWVRHMNKCRIISILAKKHMKRCSETLAIKKMKI